MATEAPVAALRARTLRCRRCRHQVSQACPETYMCVSSPLPKPQADVRPASPATILRPYFVIAIEARPALLLPTSALWPLTPWPSLGYGLLMHPPTQKAKCQSRLYARFVCTQFGVEFRGSVLGGLCYHLVEWKCKYKALYIRTHELYTSRPALAEGASMHQARGRGGWPRTRPPTTHVRVHCPSCDSIPMVAASSTSDFGGG